MSRAFVKEAEEAQQEEALAELRVSPHRNLVTRAGLEHIESELRRLNEAIAAAQAQQERATIARLARDLRYWSARRSSAELVPPPGDRSIVRFGSRVTLARAGRPPVSFLIVGEDEAAPAAGRISYVSPLAQALLGRAVGDHAPFGTDEAAIVAID